jgi:hypothetical protein
MKDDQTWWWAQPNQGFWRLVGYLGSLNALW